MQIRSQYLIQDNHNDYTSEPPFSRARAPLPVSLPLVYTRVRASTARYTVSPPHPPPLFAGRALILLTLPPSLTSVLFLAPTRSCTLGSWKCLDALRRPAGSRGKNATLLIIKYARDAARGRREGGKEGGTNGRYVICGCTVWFGSTCRKRWRRGGFLRRR